MAFQGHGRCGGPTITCSNGNQSVVGGNCVRGCTSAFDCGFNSPPGTYPEAACVAFPQYKTGGQRSSACVWGTDRYLVTNSSLDINGGSVVITGSQASPTGRDFMRLGESVSSGTWAGAGTDGGANMALFLASCATFPGLEFTLRASMAGVHQINTVSVHYTGDWADSPDMASIFGAYYAAHPSSMVKDAWSYVVAHTTTGSGCGSKYDTGMAHGGFNGCGSLVTFATGADTAEARTHLNETWSTLQVNNKQDAQANNAVALMRTCNYDCVKYPPTL
jgi:hypothetical protein